jgi:serine/threonine protein kinase
MESLGDYQLLRLLAQGGMADIYLGRHALDGRYVAVKVLGARRNEDADACTLFQDEARVAGMLCHVNLAGVHEIAEDAGVHYLAMEYVHGADLREILAHASASDRAIPYDCALTIITAAAAGLDRAHRRCDADGRPLHLVHRDVSLSNIMVGFDGTVKVVDFGIAQSAASLHRTNPGVVRGKASYMSPEQALGDRVDLRTDVFALGIVLYELTTGRRCFQGETDFERMLAVVRGTWIPPSVHVQDFPPALERVIRTALAPDPAHRYPSAAAMIEDLETVAALEGWTLGYRKTSCLMRELFGVMPFPHDDDDDRTICEEIVLPVEEPVAQPTVVVTRRRLARGSVSNMPYSSDANTDAGADADDAFDDTPTRGRPSAPRLPPVYTA